MRAPAAIALMLLATGPTAALSWPASVPLDLPPSSATLRIRAEQPGEPFPHQLLGVAGNPTTVSVKAALAAADLPLMRIYAYLDRAAPTPQHLDWTEFDQRLGAARASGAEPLVVLAYMPSWLAACPSGGPAEPRFCPPADWTVWKGLARAAVAHAVQWGVRDFEVWNEPDNPSFWRGTLPDYLALYETTAAAVVEASAEFDLALRVGGPGLWYPNAPWLAAWLAHARQHALPVDFISYHWYADYPFFTPDQVPELGALDTPAARVETFTSGARLVRAVANRAGFAAVPLWLDEWSAHAGPSDRTLGAYGAAFLPAALAAIRAGGIEKAHFFSVEREVNGLFAPGGGARPWWGAFRALLALEGAAVPVEGAGDPAVLGLAARGPDGTLHAVLDHFDAQVARSTTTWLVIDGGSGRHATLRDLDGNVWFEGPWPAEGLAFSFPDLTVLQFELAP